MVPRQSQGRINGSEVASKHIVQRAASVASAPPWSPTLLAVGTPVPAAAATDARWTGPSASPRTTSPTLGGGGAAVDAVATAASASEADSPVARERASSPRSGRCKSCPLLPDPPPPPASGTAGELSDSPPLPLDPAGPSEYSGKSFRNSGFLRLVSKLAEANRRRTASGSRIDPTPLALSSRKKDTRPVRIVSVVQCGFHFLGCQSVMVRQSPLSTSNLPLGVIILMAGALYGYSGGKKILP
mmetsp:Transcript_124428/g.311119  ORF Transcript_124428/g.311119 Transcript_124428/m.311119 type:complete len:243 (+) Transcript_124428:394-1122(+)